MCTRYRQFLRIGKQQSGMQRGMLELEGGLSKGKTKDGGCELSVKWGLLTCLDAGMRAEGTVWKG